MKKFFIAFMLFFGLFSQSTLAADFDEPPGVSSHQEASRWYVGAGVAELVSPSGIPISQKEAGYLANQTFWKSNRTEENRRLAKEVAVGYQMTNAFALELGYIRGDSGTKATTTAIMPTFDWNTGLPISVPITISQKETLSAWHLSFVGKKPLNDYVSVMARIGMMRASTDWEQRQTYSWPANFNTDGSSQVWNRSSSRETLLYGLGFTAKVANNTHLRVEWKKSSAMPTGVTSAVLLFQL